MTNKSTIDRLAQFLEGVNSKGWDNLKPVQRIIAQDYAKRAVKFFAEHDIDGFALSKATSAVFNSDCGIDTSGEVHTAILGYFRALRELI